jgi:ribosomal protein L14
MLQRQSWALVLDASGAGWVQLFHLYRGSYRRFTHIGEYAKAAVKVVAFYPRRIWGKRYRPLRVGHKTRGLLLQTRFAVRFADSARVVFFQNAMVLLRRRGTMRTKANPTLLSRCARRQQYESIFGRLL